MKDWLLLTASIAVGGLISGGISSTPAATYCTTYQESSGCSDAHSHHWIWVGTGTSYRAMRTGP